MKPHSFEYVRPTSRESVLNLLGEDPDESKILSGGQSLVPMMNFRLARPGRLIDINAVPALEGIDEDGGQLRVAARTRHHALHNLSGCDPLARLLRRSVSWLGIPARICLKD